jgi:hypothetical protein
VVRRSVNARWIPFSVGAILSVARILECAWSHTILVAINNYEDRALYCRQQLSAHVRARNSTRLR